jgi:hypothetical protein
MIHRFLAPARAELEEAVDYYEGCRPGLGVEFAADIGLAGCFFWRFGGREEVIRKTNGDAPNSCE